MTTARTILVIEDETPIREMLRFVLGQAGFSILEAEDGKQAILLLASHTPNLILLDWMLPGASGLEIARYLKHHEKSADIPLIMLTARATEDSKVKGLEVGADDYIVKPFSPRELVARVNAVLRRTSPDQEILEHAGLRLELAMHRVSANGQEIKLGPLEYRLLRFLMGHPNRVYSRAQLLDRVWGDHSNVDERSVDVCVRRLRAALGATHKQLIQTVHGIGYRFSLRKSL